MNPRFIEYIGLKIIKKFCDAAGRHCEQRRTETKEDTE
jgi:hypothetical protein